MRLFGVNQLGRYIKKEDITYRGLSLESHSTLSISLFPCPAVHPSPQRPLSALRVPLPTQGESWPLQDLTGHE